MSEIFIGLGISFLFMAIVANPFLLIPAAAFIAFGCYLSI